MHVIAALDGLFPHLDAGFATRCVPHSCSSRAFVCILALPPGASWALGNLGYRTGGGPFRGLVRRASQRHAEGTCFKLANPTW